MNSTWPQVILLLLVAISLADAILVGRRFPPKDENKQVQQIQQRMNELSKNYDIKDRFQSYRVQQRRAKGKANEELERILEIQNKRIRANYEARTNRMNRGRTYSNRPKWSLSVKNLNRDELKPVRFQNPNKSVDQPESLKKLKKDEDLNPVQLQAKLQSTMERMKKLGTIVEQ